MKKQILDYRKEGLRVMFSVAQMFNVSVDALIAANPYIPNPNVIFPFDVLCVP